ncbi:MAG: hypothetical protein O3B01_29845 [Planctomycetota bacterium]|nr:hypothetical protein [Planctomycetota bacterium]
MLILSYVDGQNYSWSSHPQLHAHLTQLHGLDWADVSGQQHFFSPLEVGASAAICELPRINTKPPNTMDATIARVQDRNLLFISYLQPSIDVMVTESGVYDSGVLSKLQPNL